MAKKTKKPAKKKKLPARAPEASRKAKSGAGKFALGSNGDPVRVRAILHKLDEAYPAATCALKHENAFQLPRVNDSIGAMHGRAREYRDRDAVPEVSVSEGICLCRPEGARTGHPPDGFLSQ